MNIKDFDTAVEEDVKAFYQATGNYFKDLRVQFGLEADQVAIFLDEDEEKIRAFEAGERMLSHIALAKLARSYSQSLREVLMSISMRLG